MRRLLAGIALFSVLIPAAAFADPKGEVESIGFGSLFRPNCHVPMLVRVQADKSGTYQIRIHQKDLDADEPIFTQTVSLTGAEDGKGAEQRFWLYFIPQPTDGGLPDTSRGGNLRDLQQQLKVVLCDETGKELIPLPVTKQIWNLDKPPPGMIGTPRGVKLVLAVSAGGSSPVYHDYQNALGLMEDVVFVTLQPRDLPEDVRGYESVDAIVWLNAPVPDPAKAADEKRFHAIQQYVRGGGHLVVCQPPQRDTTLPFADMLPVDVKEILPRSDLEPLKTIATTKQRQVAAEIASGGNNIVLKPGDTDPDAQKPSRPAYEDWDRPQGPFMYARGELKPGAIIVEGEVGPNSIDELVLKWDTTGADRTPYIARIGYGAGAVTWVAQDLSDPAIIAKARSGWPYVWNRVLDLKNDLLIVDNRTTDAMKRPYILDPSSSAQNLARSLRSGMELTSKSQILISIAVVFFIAYWLLAGPGLYFYLVTKSRPQLSWFLFAFSALVATLLTVLVVKLVVRGAPELHHVTVVRAAAGEQAVALSRFGLYIPRDGVQEIKLPEVAPREVSYLTAYPEYPGQGESDIEFPAQKQYTIPLRDAGADEPLALSIPYRSTLKKFEARRVGVIEGAIEGQGKLRMTDAGLAIAGMLTNGTGKRLRNIYIVYYDKRTNDDVIFYQPVWEKSQSINLADDFRIGSAKFIKVDKDITTGVGVPTDGVRLRDGMGNPNGARGWSMFWYARLRGGGMTGSSVADLEDAVPQSFPMLSLFDRMPPMRNPSDGSETASRMDLLRQGGRDLDVSHAVAAGRLVVLAQSDGDVALPFPLEVDGDRIDGKGIVFYQFILPLEHVSETAPATQSTTQALLKR